MSMKDDWREYKFGGQFPSHCYRTYNSLSLHKPARLEWVGPLSMKDDWRDYKFGGQFPSHCYRTYNSLSLHKPARLVNTERTVSDIMNYDPWKKWMRVVYIGGGAWCNGKHVCFPSLSPMLECGFESRSGLEFSGFSMRQFLKLVVGGFLRVLRFCSLLHRLMVQPIKCDLNFVKLDS